MAACSSTDLLGLSNPTEGLDVGESETNLCNAMITIVRAVGVHPKFVDPLIAAAFACLLLLLLDAASSMMSSCHVDCIVCMILLGRPPLQHLEAS